MSAPKLYCLAAFVGALIGAIWTNPFDGVKQQLQPQRASGVIAVKVYSPDCAIAYDNSPAALYGLQEVGPRPVAKR